MKIITIVTATLLSSGAFVHSSAQSALVQQQKGGRPPIEVAKTYDYKVLLINKEIYLKFLGNDSKAFGPFRRHDGQDGRYIYIPKDRPQQFSSAMQIYRDRTSNAWFYTDNWVQFRAKRIDPNNILPPKESEPDGTGQPATRPELKSEGSDKPQPKSEERSR